MWLLDESVLNAMNSVGGVTAEQIEAYEKTVAEASDGSPILKTSDTEASIEISGVLTDKPSFRARYFGGGNTTYPQIKQAIAEADSDPRVESITLNIDSPGGMVSGLFDTIDAIKRVNKPINGVVSGQALSAAYAIASVTDSLKATNRAAAFGSVGIILTQYVDGSTVSTTSTNAPKKNPDPTTAQGKKDIQEGLDAWHDLFVADIAEGRGTTPQKVNKTFGRGAVVLAGKALELGMIDEAEGQKAETSSTDVGGPETKQQERGMTKSEIKANHPDAYDEIVAEGVAKESDRVNAHLELAKGSGDMDSAVEAIESGAGITMTVTAKHQAAAMNRKDIEAVNEDTDEADAGDDTPEAVDAKTQADAEAEEIAAAMMAKHGGPANG